MAGMAGRRSGRNGCFGAAAAGVLHGARTIPTVAGRSMRALSRLADVLFGKFGGQVGHEGRGQCNSRGERRNFDSVTDPSFKTNLDHLLALAARHAIPAIYDAREYAVAPTARTASRSRSLPRRHSDKGSALLGYSSSPRLPCDRSISPSASLGSRVCINQLPCLARAASNLLIRSTLGS